MTLGAHTRGERPDFGVFSTFTTHAVVGNINAGHLVETISLESIHGPTQAR